MKTKLITSLDELEPGMKTKDGDYEYLQPYPERDCHFILEKGMTNLARIVHDCNLGRYFLNQEVEVPE